MQDSLNTEYNCLPAFWQVEFPSASPLNKIKKDVLFLKVLLFRQLEAIPGPDRALFGLSGNGFSPVSEYYHSTSNTLRHSPGPVGIVPRDAVQLCQLRPAIRIAMDLPGHEAKLPADPLLGPCRELSMGRVKPAG